MYNGVLLLPVLEEATLVDFADDLTVKHSQDVKVYPTKAMKTDLPENGQADPGE